MELSKQQKSIDRKFTYNTGKLPGFVDGIPSLSELLKADPRNYKDAPNDDPYTKNQRLVTTKESYDKHVASLNNPKPVVDYGNVASGAMGVIGNTIKSFNDYASEDEILAARNTGTQYIAGIPYQYKTINNDVLHAKCGKLPKYSAGSNIFSGASSGAAAGAAFGPWGVVGGTVLGGLFGGIGSMVAGEKEWEDLRKASEYTANENQFAANSAYSKYLQQKNAQTYGRQEDQHIYRFAGGKSENVGPDGLTVEPHVTQTIDGVEIRRSNSKVEPGEGVSKQLADGTIQFRRYTDGKIRNKRPGDILYAYTTPDETIWTNNRDPYTGIRFSDEAEARVRAGLPLGDLQIRMAEQQAAKKNGNATKAKYGKLPGHAAGWLGNAIPAVVGGLAGLGQMISAYNNKPYRPNTYSENQYEGAALSTLAGLRVNPYPIINELRSAEARTNRAIDIAGGLSGGQRAGARLAALNTTQGNISKLLSDIQQQNNAYRANYAQAAINAGKASRQARMEANQWDLDYYSKAHAARNRGVQTGIANMLAQIQQYQSNEFKRRQFNRTVGLYEDDQKQKQQYMGWLSNLPTSRITGLGFDNTRIDPMKQLFYYDDKTGQYVPYNS